jgi:hypothetical protein
VSAVVDASFISIQGKLKPLHRVERLCRDWRELLKDEKMNVHSMIIIAVCNWMGTPRYSVFVSTACFSWAGTQTATRPAEAGGTDLSLTHLQIVILMG